MTFLATFMGACLLILALDYKDYKNRSEASTSVQCDLIAKLISKRRANSHKLLADIACNKAINAALIGASKTIVRRR